MGIKYFNSKVLLVILVCFLTVENTQAETIKCKNVASLTTKSTDTEDNNQTTKTVENTTTKKNSKTSSNYFGMFKMLIPDTSK